MARKKEATMPRRAYDYRRVSSGKQTAPRFIGGERIARGMERQGDYAAERCEREGWFLVQDLILHDAKRSGYKQANLAPGAALRRFLDKIEDGTVLEGEVLIVEHLDRLTRADVYAAWGLFSSIINAGVWIATAEPERLYTRENVDLGTLLEVVISFAASHEQSAKLAFRLESHWRDRHEAARRGVPHGRNPPCWITDGGDRYTLDPGKAAVVRRLVDLALGGMGAPRILQYITPRYSEFPPIGRAERWSVSMITRILSDRALVGEYRPEAGEKREAAGEPVADYYPRLLTDEEWARLQAARQHRRKSYGRVSGEVRNLFTGLLRIGDTAPRLNAYPDKPGGTSRQYIVGYNANAELVHVPYHAMETHILDAIAQLRPADVLPRSKDASVLDDQIAALNGRLLSIDVRLAEQAALLADPDCPISSADLAASIAKLKEQRAEAQRELEPLRWERQSPAADNLGAVQGLVGMLREAGQEGNKNDLRSRVRGALPMVVSHIQLAAQRLSNRRLVAHVMIHFRSGEPRYLQVIPQRGIPRGDTVADLSDPEHPAWVAGYVANGPATA